MIKVTGWHNCDIGDDLDGTSGVIGTFDSVQITATILRDDNDNIIARLDALSNDLDIWYTPSGAEWTDITFEVVA